MDKKLDISSLLKASVSFSNALKTAKLIESEDFPKIFYGLETARASVIQHFEYTYELSWKMMKRFIEMEDGKIESFSNKALLRKAGELGLINDFHKWRKFHNGRNLTSHTYDEETAEEVYEIAKEFNIYLNKFIENLKKRI
jgi:nucleotidyltransferase substrate binding protein (TIGR01987 family)